MRSEAAANGVFSQRWRMLHRWQRNVGGVAILLIKLMAAWHQLI